MKNAVMIFISTFLAVVALMSVMTVMGRMHRSSELQMNFSTAAEQAVAAAKEEEVSSDRMPALCLENLVFSLDSNAEITFQVMKADAEKGMLAVRTTENFTHPNGMEGKTGWERITIWNKKEEKEMHQYQVSFYKTKADMLAGKNCYKSYQVREGERIEAPKEPFGSEENFFGWRDMNQYIADFSLPICQNQVYYAVD